MVPFRLISEHEPNEEEKTVLKTRNTSFGSRQMSKTIFSFAIFRSSLNKLFIIGSGLVLGIRRTDNLKLRNLCLNRLQHFFLLFNLCYQSMRLKLECLLCTEAINIHRKNSNDATYHDKLNLISDDVLMVCLFPISFHQHKVFWTDSVKRKKTKERNKKM
ncbi:CLUMA_CG007815, isoform A [Clunio marinus]|uniref:CLUMA_CG007815, isoform A n=1 Tax=Clunio marinus TaxID=568069 RepID=A0A1J1I3X5_9DIPT|nr:CLUMA_CG007815, isoform A [Clunio marinus]